MAAPETPDASSWGQFFLFLTTVAGFAFQFLREAIRHRREDAREKRAAEERIRQAAEVQRQLQIEAETVKQRLAEEAAALKERHDMTHLEILENTEVSRQAFHEANGVNQKIADLQKRFDDLMGRRARESEQQDHAETG